MNYMERALESYRTLSFDENYGLPDESTYEEDLPGNEESLNHAIQSVINFACCAESCYNLAINEYYRNKMITKKLDLIFRLSIRKKIDEINILYKQIIPCDLSDNLLMLAKTRNDMVHYKEPVMFCGGSVMGKEFHLLKKENMKKISESVSALISIFWENGILHSDIRSTDAPIIGDGDICLESEDTISSDS